MFLDLDKRKIFFQNLSKIFAVLFLLIFLLPQGAEATPSRCTSEGGSCCGTERDPDQASHPEWACVETVGREGGQTGCASSLCSGLCTTENCSMCCPPASGEEGEPEEGGSGGSSVRESLGTAARGAGISTSGSISGTIQKVISAVLGFVGVIFLVLMIVGGMMWMNAGGNEDTVGKAKKLITNAVIGVIIVMAAYLLVSLVMGTIAG